MAGSLRLRTLGLEAGDLVLETADPPDERPDEREGAGGQEKRENRATAHERLHSGVPWGVWT
jgi:hypothetical protein